MQTLNTGASSLLLTVPLGVKASGLSRAMLYRSIADGNLRRKKMGRSTFILTDSLVKLVNNLPE